MTNKFDVELTDEEQERYNHLKDLSLKFYPQISDDSVMSNLSEYLYIYYAKHGCLPDPLENDAAKECHTSNEPRIIEYRTPADAGDSLIRS